MRLDPEESVLRSIKMKKTRGIRKAKARPMKARKRDALKGRRPIVKKFD